MPRSGSASGLVGRFRRATGLHGVGQLPEPRNHHVESHGVVHLSPLTGCGNDPCIAQDTQVPRDDRKVCGTAPGDLADCTGPAALGEPGEDGQPVGVTERLEESGGLLIEAAVVPADRRSRRIIAQLHHFANNSSGPSAGQAAG